VRNPDAYERLIMDVVRGNQTLFMRRDEVEAAWAWIDPILNAWEETAQTAQTLHAGTWGPSSAIALIERDGRTWHEDGGRTMGGFIFGPFQRQDWSVTIFCRMRRGARPLSRFGPAAIGRMRKPSSGRMRR
jgi:hypothetical protein